MARRLEDKAPMKPVRTGMRRKGQDSGPRVVINKDGSVTYYAAVDPPPDPEQEDEQVPEKKIPEYDLDPCPFCNGRARMENFPESSYYVECTKCHVYTSSYDTPWQAARRWNKRPGQPYRRLRRSHPRKPPQEKKEKKSRRNHDLEGQTLFDFMSI